MATGTVPRLRPKGKQAAPFDQAILADVLTLEEAADYLRVPATEVVRLVTESGLPGRKTSTDWRFLKSAIQVWLTQPERPLGNSALLALAGQFANDPFLDEIVEEVYSQRKRPAAKDSP